MPQNVLPAVVKILPCDEAVYEIAGERWVLVNPWTSTVELPPGTSFPFRANDVWVY